MFGKKKKTYTYTLFRYAYIFRLPSFVLRMRNIEYKSWKIEMKNRLRWMWMVWKKLNFSFLSDIPVQLCFPFLGDGTKAWIAHFCRAIVVASTIFACYSYYIVWNVISKLIVTIIINIFFLLVEQFRLRTTIKSITLWFVRPPEACETFHFVSLYFFSPVDLPNGKPQIEAMKRKKGRNHGLIWVVGKHTERKKKLDGITLTYNTT